MTIKYVGNRQFKTRLAEFTYEDHEETRFEKIVEYMRNEGYDIDTGCANWAAIEVDNRDEYEQVVETYKKAKKIIK